MCKQASGGDLRHGLQFVRVRPVASTNLCATGARAGGKCIDKCLNLRYSSDLR